MAAKKPAAKATRKPAAKPAGGKVAGGKVASSPEVGGVRIDPNLPLIPGNSVTFVAEGREGRTMAKISTARGSDWVATSTGVAANEERVSKILESGHGDVTVEFYEDGELYASGTWPVG